MKSGELLRTFKAQHGVIRSVAFLQNESKDRISIEDVEGKLNQMMKNNLNIQMTDVEMNEILFNNMKINGH